VAGSSPAPRRRLGAQFWWESGGALASAVLAIITLIDAEWIELVFGVDPDHGSGLLEWGIVIAAITTTALLSWLARRDWRAGAAAGAQEA
jgi:hypothetical protein